MSGTNNDGTDQHAVVTGGGGHSRETDTEGSVDERILARQLGRRPRPFAEVCPRCRYDYPQVSLTEPLHRRGDPWEVLPTVYWLTCPRRQRASRRLDADGHV